MNKQAFKIIMLLLPPLAVLLIILFALMDDPVPSVTKKAEDMIASVEEEEEELPPTPVPRPTQTPTPAPEADPTPEPTEETSDPELASGPTPRGFIPSPTSKDKPTPTKGEGKKDLTPTPRAKLTPRPPKQATETPTPEETPSVTPSPEATPESLSPTPTEAEAEGFDEDSRDCKNLILDMDYSTDVDDVAALRIATQLDKKGRIKLLAVMSSVQGEDVCKAIHGQLSYDGYPEVPIGMSAKDVPSHSPYWTAFIEEYFDEDSYTTKDSVSLYKQKIRECAAKGEKVRIVTTGFLVNIEALLRDEPGYELVKEHVDAIWIVGGAFPLSGSDYNFCFNEDSINAARYVNENCPVKLVYSTNKTTTPGNDQTENRSIKCGKELDKKDKTGKDPVNLAYRRYESYYGVKLSEGHDAWDPICVWAAALTREECRIKLSEANTVIHEDGSNTFTPGPNRLRKIIARTSEDFDWYTMQLDAWIYSGIRN